MRTWQPKTNDGGGADTITATKMGAGEQNSALVELAGAVSPTGQTLSDAAGTTPVEKTNQLAQALFINALSAQTFQDGGIADAYIVTPVTGSGGLVVPDAYANMNGAVLSFIPSAVPTGASTLDFGQTAGTLLGTKKILSLAGAALVGGEFNTTQYHEFRYDTAADAATGAWIFIGVKSPVAGGLFDAYGKWSDTKASTVDGGTFTNSAWRTRDLNTENSDVAGLGNIVAASNQLTLEAGTYVCLVRAPANEVALHAARLFDTTGVAVLLDGTSERAPSNATTASIISDRFTIAVQSVLEIQHWCSVSQGTTGFGVATSIALRSELYTTIELWRVA